MTANEDRGLLWMCIIVEIQPQLESSEPMESGHRRTIERVGKRSLANFEWAQNVRFDPQNDIACTKVTLFFARWDGKTVHFLGETFFPEKVGCLLVVANSLSPQYNPMA